MDSREALYLKKFSDFAKDDEIMSGDKIKIGDVAGREIEIVGYKIGDSKFEGKKLLTLQIKLNGEDRVVFTSSGVLIDQTQKYKNEMPFITTIEKVNNKFYSFT